METLIDALVYATTTVDNATILLPVEKDGDNLKDALLRVSREYPEIINKVQSEYENAVRLGYEVYDAIHETATTLGIRWKYFIGLVNNASSNPFGVRAGLLTVAGYKSIRSALSNIPYSFWLSDIVDGHAFCVDEDKKYMRDNITEVSPYEELPVVPAITFLGLERYPLGDIFVFGMNFIHATPGLAVSKDIWFLSKYVDEDFEGEISYDTSDIKDLLDVDVLTRINPANHADNETALDRFVDFGKALKTK